MSLNKPCHICTKISMGNQFYFKELVKTDEGKGTYHERFICDSCKGELTHRCIHIIKDSVPRALAENIIHELKETYV